MRYIPNKIVNLYNKSPIWTRNFASTGYGFLKSRKEKTKLFWQCLAELEESQWWSLEKLQELQSERLKNLIKHCAEHVPYYQKKFAEYGIIPSQIQTPDDLKKLPTLTKEDVRGNTVKLIANNFDKKKLIAESTSGTTGTPLTVWHDDKTYVYQKAVQFLHHQWAGYNNKEWIGILAGYKVVSINRSKPPFWVKNYIGKQIHFSTYHLNSNNTKFYYYELKKSRVKYLLGYPSAIGLLAKFINNYTHESIPMKGIFLSSEPIYDWQREEIKRAFQCNIYDYFGQAEKVTSAISCGMTSNLHLNMELSAIELVKFDDKNFNIIGTSLVNYAMPLIRYELNDLTSGILNNCPCGRKHTLLKPIDTKMEDYVITPEGNLISASLLTFPFKRAKGIIESQIIQNDKNSLIVKLVTNNLFTNDEKFDLIDNILSCVGLNMKIFIEKVDKIPRTKNGKFRFVISEIKDSQPNNI